MSFVCLFCSTIVLGVHRRFATAADAASKEEGKNKSEATLPADGASCFVVVAVALLCVCSVARLPIFTNCTVLSYAAWTVEEVRAWAREEVGLDEDDAGLLVKNKLDGVAVIKMAKQPQEKLQKALVKVPYSLSGGAAVKLADAISSLGSTAQGEPVCVDMCVLFSVRALWVRPAHLHARCCGARWGRARGSVFFLPLRNTLLSVCC
jgi:hypothetical protein